VLNGMAVSGYLQNAISALSVVFVHVLEMLNALLLVHGMNEMKV
jgi:hypothetical protein